MGEKIARVPPEKYPGFVYLVEEDEDRRNGRVYCKIGRSVNPAQRAVELQVGNPRKLFLSAVLRTGDTVGLEAKYHKRFAHFRLVGEWFDLSQSAVNQMALRSDNIIRLDQGLDADELEE
jgi:hypothetical protein